MNSGRRRGRNSRTSFLAGPGVLRGRILTPVSRRQRKREGETETAVGNVEKEREEKRKAIKARAFRELYFSRHLYGRLTLAIR